MKILGKGSENDSRVDSPDRSYMVYNVKVVNNDQGVHINKYSDNREGEDHEKSDH